MTGKLFEPITINGMTLKNRIGFAPMLNMPGIMTTFMVQEETIRWFEARARGGAGLLMTGTFGPFMLDMPGAIEPFAQLAERIHALESRIGVQLGDGGPMLGQGPSPLPYPDANDPKKTVFEITQGAFSPFPGIETVQALTVEQIEQYGDKFAGYALAMKNAAIDCVELHCAHGGATLFCSFISPFYNRRRDEYGGSWENRLRFPTAVLKKMRAAVGPDYPILVRISADELLGDKGITLKDTLDHIVPALEDAGVDCFDVSQGSILHSPEGVLIPMYYPRGCFIHHAEAVKKATRLPVIGVGRIVDLDMAAQLLEDGKADLIYLARQLTSDPDTPNKFAEGRKDEIRKCVACLEGCGNPCPINYDIAPDASPLTPARHPRKVLVVGGGVAGMEAARVCALRGHTVTLMEKGSALGGTVALLALDPLTAEFRNIVDYLSVQMRKLKVDVKLDSDAETADIDGLKPDAIVLATGASLIVPDIARGKPGVMDHLEALRRKADIGRRVVIWGLMYGAELAISLAREGRSVVLMGEADQNSLSSHASADRRYWVLRKLTDIDVVREGSAAARLGNLEVLFNTKVRDITSQGIEAEDKEGRKSILPFDTLIISRGRRKNDAIYRQLEAKAPVIYKIGDCAAAGNIQKAVWSANQVARMICCCTTETTPPDGCLGRYEEGRYAMSEATMSPEEFKNLFTGKTDEEILTLTQGNEEALLDGVFEAMRSAFDPSKAVGQDAVIQYAIDGSAAKLNYQLNVKDGVCDVSKGTADDPRVTMALSLPNFVRMSTGELNGMQAFMSGKLKISGDLMFSQSLASWFNNA